MENETLKQLVLAKGKEVWNNETNDPKASGFRVHSNDGKHLDVHNYRRTVHCKLSDDLTSEDNAWAIAADLLGIAQPVPIFDSQLRELCVALGWQGGTYHQVLAEVKRLKAAAPKSNKGIPQPPAFIFDPSKEWDVCDDCKGYSVVPGPCGTCGGRGTSRKGLEKVLSAITDWRKTVLQAWQKPTDTRTESHC